MSVPETHPAWWIAAASVQLDPTVEYLDEVDRFAHLLADDWMINPALIEQPGLIVTAWRVSPRRYLVTIQPGERFLIQIAQGTVVSWQLSGFTTWKLPKE